MWCRLVWVLALACMTSSVFAVRDVNVCRPPDEAKNANGGKMKPPNRPRVNSEFETHVVMNIISGKMTKEFHQFFSYQGNHAVIEEREYGHRTYGYADYSNNEFLTISPDEHKCNVDSLANNPNRFIYGYKRSSGKPHVPTAESVLHILQSDDDTLERYVGPQTIRGIPCHVWYTCTYWKDMESTMDLYWYFSDPDHWTPGSGPGSVPVRAWVKGVRHDTNNGSRAFEHKYDFFHWKNKITRPYYWQTPRAVSCPGRINTKPMPALATKFVFTLEQVDKDLGLVTFVKEAYDYDRRLFRFDYRASGNKARLFGDNILTEIHDFQTGVAYIIDSFRGNCSIQPIEENSLDDLTSDQTHVVMRNAAEFLYLDDEKPTYEGIKKIRGLDCDTWVATRNNFPPGTRLNSTWEWAFTANTWSTSQDLDASVKGGDLVQLTLTQGSDTTTYYNIYNFEKKEPAIMDFDIGACYVNRNRRVFHVSFPASSSSFIVLNLKAFKEAVVKSIALQTGISPLRVANVQVSFEKDVILSFELLDKAPVPGDLPYTKDQVDLDAAADLLYNSVRTNTFNIPISAGDGSEQIQTVDPSPNSIKEEAYHPHTPEDGYSTGMSAGVGVAMLVVGVAAGGGGAFIVNKKCMNG